MTTDTKGATKVTFQGTSGLRLVADRWGDEDHPPVVFLHGGGQTRHAWSGAAQAVAAHGHCAYTLDLRGHGDSGWAPDGDYSSEAFEDDLLELAKQIDRSPVLVGASLGGLTSLAAEARAPFARALVMVDVAPRLESPGVLRILRFMAGKLDGFATLEEAADAVASYMPHRPRPSDLSGLQKNLRQGADGRLRWHWDPALMSRWDERKYSEEVIARINGHRLDLARKIRIPTRLIRGRMSDVVSPEGAQEFLDAVPHASYVDLAEAGHMVAGDRNDAFTRSVLEFLAALPPWGVPSNFSESFQAERVVA